MTVVSTDPSLSDAFGRPRRTSILATLRARVQCWDARQRQRRQLAEFPDKMLRDIGTSRGDADIEAVKPFWRA